MPPKTHRNWTVEINNFCRENVDAIKALPSATYIHIVEHLGQESRIPHIHALIQFSRSVSLKFMRDHLGPYHLEPLIDFAAYTDYMLGHGEYEGKDGVIGELFKMGEPHTNQGSRVDIQAIKDRILAGQSMPDVLPLITNYQHLKFAENLQKYSRAPPVDTKKEIFWIWGPTGVGKTRAALDLCANDFDSTWISSRNLKWWDGYHGQPNVIIDEFRADFCTFHELLRILDIYPFRVENKGGSCWLRAKRIIITSCFPPDKVYHTREDLGQLIRRLTAITELTPKNPDFHESPILQNIPVDLKPTSTT